MSVENQIMILYAGVNNHLMDIPVLKMSEFEKEFLEFMNTHHRDIGKGILEKKKLDDELKEKLNSAIDEFKKIFLA